mgnify:CR=1 FL=1
MQTIDNFNFAGKKAIVRVDFNVPLDENGKITEINFQGDFLGVRDWRDIKEQFIGLEFEPSAILEVLETNKEGQYFGTIQNTELSEMFKADYRTD